MIVLQGTLVRITFRNDENHYIIARIKTRETREPVVVVGTMPGVSEGETLKLTGQWITHPKYGDQFKVDRFEVTLPATVAGIRRYLGSGIIKGIGMIMAKKIVEQFKERSLEVIENEPERLREIPGIGKSKADLITRAWDKHHAIRKVMRFLQDHDVGTAHASAILRYYGTESLKVLKNNPYSVARDVPEAGFEVADAIALKAGFKQDDPERIKACLLFLLCKKESDGHVFAELDPLTAGCISLTRADKGDVDKALGVLADDGEVVVEDDHVYLVRLHRAEKGIASRIRAMLCVPLAPPDLSDEAITTEVAVRLAVKLSDEQIDVVKQVLAHRVVVITGGPGTGKTTLIRAVCAIFRKFRNKITLAAPTGRAARRLAQVTDNKASTLHRLLLCDPDTGEFARNLSNPLDSDVVIVDEASMVDTMLMFHLIQAVPVNAVLILVGDIFQLPSVGPGNVLADIIASKAVKIFSLTRIFRQAEKSPIVMNAHLIRNGEMPCLENSSEGLSEFYFIESSSPERVVSTIVELCSNRIKKAFPHVDEIQVLTPMHKGEAGTINLNQKLQQVLNKASGGIEAGGLTFKTGDKVMHLKNNYQKEVFNGDIGIIHEVVKSEGRLSVDYDGRMVDYDLLELDELTLAYAVSVHKSQGSEYSAVVIAMTVQHYPLLQRNLLYTAMTRGKNLVIVVGSRRSVEIALHNNRTDCRLSGLCKRLEMLETGSREAC
ncbi:MAG: ATP-dependent RecD-like DNA helicase [Desulfobacterium sp.]|jgi:exodeoxyribonuclease V alpha subunit|nr:ATP-dependent RecD-like DNA helicase [Desulfobacterium sp.]